MSWLTRVSFATSILWELPLAALSFLFFKVTRFLVRRLLSLYYVLRSKSALRWQFASAELLDTPGALPMIMTTGPRWNTHAIVGTAGPVVVQDSLTVNVAAAERSARVWTLVVCTFPGYRTVTTVGSLNAPFGGSSERLSLSPGKYWIALRYYHWKEAVELPEMLVDGARTIPAVSVPRGVNDFYSTFADRRGLFYTCLHYYVFVSLKYRRYLPAGFVEREFVPLGNPETTFHFGAVQAGERLSIQVSPQLLSSHDVYLTLYNLASFPIASHQVTRQDFMTAESPASYVYLIRTHPNGGGPAGSERDALRIAVVGRAQGSTERHPDR